MSPVTVPTTWFASGADTACHFEMIAVGAGSSARLRVTRWFGGMLQMCGWWVWSVTTASMGPMPDIERGVLNRR